MLRGPLDGDARGPHPGPCPRGGTLRDPDNSRTFISARVVKAALRRLMQRPTHTVSAIGLTVDDGRLEHVTVELVWAYGQVLPELGDGLRVEIAAELTALLGGDPTFDPVTNISVEVVDVVAGDPRKD